jgi:hypothetical protein
MSRLQFALAKPRAHPIVRVDRPIVLNAESRRQLERQARGRTVPMGVALRSRIVLLAADGKQHKQHKQIREELKSSPRASWLNMVERFFRDLTENQLGRGIFKNLEYSPQ